MAGSYIGPYGTFYCPEGQTGYMDGSCGGGSQTSASASHTGSQEYIVQHPTTGTSYRITNGWRPRFWSNGYVDQIQEGESTFASQPKVTIDGSMGQNRNERKFTPVTVDGEANSGPQPKPTINEHEQKNERTTLPVPSPANENAQQSKPTTEELPPLPPLPPMISDAVEKKVRQEIAAVRQQTEKIRKAVDGLDRLSQRIKGEASPSEDRVLQSADLFAPTEKERKQNNGFKQTGDIFRMLHRRIDDAAKDISDRISSIQLGDNWDDRSKFYIGAEYRVLINDLRGLQDEIKQKHGDTAGSNSSNSALWVSLAWQTIRAAETHLR